jgi:hypothetical protein
MKKILVLLLVLPMLAIAEVNGGDAKEVLHQNSGLVEQFAQLAPMGINPYATVFMTAICTKVGFHNAFVATNPFFDNWFVLVFFGVLFLFTAVVGTIFKTNKATASLALADNYLSNHAALIINFFIILAPTLLSNDVQNEQIVYQAGFLSISFKTLLVLLVSMYFLVVVMSVRFFLDILIFLSPVPFIDSIIEILKIIVTLLFVFISIVSPLTSVIISVLMFMVAIVFYRRSVRLVNSTKYFIIYPILSVFKRKTSIESKAGEFSVLVYTARQIGKIKKGKIVRLVKEQEHFFLVKQRFGFKNNKEKVSFEGGTVRQNRLKTQIIDAKNEKLLVLNRNYHSVLDDIIEVLKLKMIKEEKFEIQFHKTALSRLKAMFGKSDLNEFKTIGE